MKNQEAASVFTFTVNVCEESHFSEELSSVLITDFKGQTSRESQSKSS